MRGFEWSKITGPNAGGPRHSPMSGEIVTWGQKIQADGTIRCRGRFRGGTGKRWDEAERSVLEGLSRHDLSDVFRALHGYRPIPT